MAISMALAMPAASAAFLYLPPEETSRNAAPAAGSDIGSTAAGQATEGASGVSPAGRTIVRGPGENAEGVSVEMTGTTTTGSRRFETESPLRRAVTTADARPGAPANGVAEAAAHRTGLWRVSADETLRGVLDRWAGRAGVEVLFLTDRRYRLHEARGFEGSFAEAAQALLGALAHMPHAPVGEPRSGGRTLVVLHRARPAGEAR